ncbi:hypothetical protein K437DRAFT_179618 [Tilletiaria anomala UBC 951]|uniref:Uncharacterized protein n=1 Tax=Tilletiaria anomala (strain ATCC 24038 / CBS 436.72 / UBC 951) TaxID=1037660 RepID=A0A066VI01_TILAU|nr:uncharacterized protein K437DRAFT_179618 [Tilletiaria anomala UBC 951]KDN41141.1 hypothetical protein K437DRAFT_179618 [Tilletiaria anomala UBC 951]
MSAVAFYFHAQRSTRRHRERFFPVCLQMDRRVVAVFWQGSLCCKAQKVAFPFVTWRVIHTSTLIKRTSFARIGTANLIICIIDLNFIFLYSSLMRSVSEDALNPDLGVRLHKRSSRHLLCTPPAMSKLETRSRCRLYGETKSHRSIDQGIRCMTPHATGWIAVDAVNERALRRVQPT